MPEDPAAEVSTFTSTVSYVVVNDDLERAVEEVRRIVGLTS